MNRERVFVPPYDTGAAWDSYHNDKRDLGAGKMEQRTGIGKWRTSLWLLVLILG